MSAPDSEPVWHWMLEPAATACGEDYPGLCRTAIREHITCPRCIKLYLKANFNKPLWEPVADVVAECRARLVNNMRQREEPAADDRARGYKLAAIAADGDVWLRIAGKPGHMVPLEAEHAE